MYMTKRIFGRYQGLIQVTLITIVIAMNLASGSNIKESNTSTTNHGENSAIEITLAPNEFWWGGLSVDGMKMPYDINTSIHRNLMDNRGNQSQPLLISSLGRFVWCNEPFEFSIRKGKLSVKSEFAAIQNGSAGTSVRDVFKHVKEKFFAPSGILPDSLLFTAPQYNTWIELMYNKAMFWLPASPWAWAEVPAKALAHTCILK